MKKSANVFYKIVNAGGWVGSVSYVPKLNISKHHQNMVNILIQYTQKK